ncbi:hypothetical protein CBL_00677 [Carabus blaptoides fortunei]
MSSKRANEFDKPVKKKMRSSHSLKLKLEIIRRIESGERQKDICRDYGLAGSTIRTILKNKDKIKEFGRIATPLAAVKLIKNRAPIMVEMERLLTIWIDDQTQRCVPVSSPMIQDKAKSLYEDLKPRFMDVTFTSDDEGFKASLGWLDRYKRRASMENIVIKTEVQNTVLEEIMSYKSELAEIIEEGGYSPQQVFNVNETGLFWKRMPEKSFIFNQEEGLCGIKSSKLRLTILLGGNAAGDFKLKPMLVYHSENPSALKGYSKGLLPVIWKANRKASVTRQLFENWFTDYFCPAVKEYCAEENLENKALLLLGNSPGHSTGLEDLCDNIKVVFLPRNTTSMQPMDQGVFAEFKTYYLRRTFNQAVRACEGENAFNFTEFWNDYNIRQAIDNIGASWDEVPAKTMNMVWKKLYPECVQFVDDFDNTLDTIKENIVELGKKIGLDDLTVDDIQKVLDSHREELSNEDLMAIDQQRALEENESNEEEEDAEPPKVLTAPMLNEFFKLIDQATAIIDLNDPNRVRSSAVARKIQEDVSCYRELLREKQKNRKHLVFDQYC